MYVYRFLDGRFRSLRKVMQSPRAKAHLVVDPPIVRLLGPQFLLALKFVSFRLRLRRPGHNEWTEVRVEDPCVTNNRYPHLPFVAAGCLGEVPLR